jgi:hypothetical protein
MKVQVYAPIEALAVSYYDHKKGQWQEFLFDFGCKEWVSLLVQEIFRRFPPSWHMCSKQEAYDKIKTQGLQSYNNHEFSTSSLYDLGLVINSIVRSENHLEVVRFPSYDKGLLVKQITSKIHKADTDFRYKELTKEPPR